jgi:hypothetical protein
MDVRSCRFDPDLGMFIEPPRDPDLARLWFLRWFIERGRLEHRHARMPSR